VVARIVRCMESYLNPSEHEPEIAAVSYDPDPVTSSTAGLVKDRNEARLLAIDGVKGVGAGRDSIGRDAIIVYISGPSVSQRLPDTVDGLPVVPKVTPEIDALAP
jgi:hypothetical protein